MYAVKRVTTHRLMSEKPTEAIAHSSVIITFTIITGEDFVLPVNLSVTLSELSFSASHVCLTFLMFSSPFYPLPHLAAPPLPPLMCFFCLQEADSCQHCGGSGCAPCSLCHGSKLSMLANRFNESISDLRCQACYPHGLERCQSCSSK